MRSDMEIWSEIRREVLSRALTRRAAVAKDRVGWHFPTKILSHDEPPVDGEKELKQHASRQRSASGRANCGA